MKYIKTYKKLFEANIITKLDYSDENLTELPELPKTLERLYCFNNKLTSLPELPKTLERLYCYINQLTILPELPNSLKTLYCDNNKLTELSKLPKSLITLYCENNQLTELPDLYFHKNLISLQCYGNNNLPYNDLTTYRLWYEKTYPDRITAREFNI